MIRLLAALLVLATHLVQAQDVIHVKAGETRELAPADGVLSLQRLVLEDNAVLSLAPGLGQVQIDVARAEIGRNVKIVARGEAGADGQPGASIPGQAPTCSAGKPGTAGTDGQPGDDGGSLILNVGIAELGSLTVDTRGGAGGDGGTGGAGQRGGEIDKCNAPAGGAGGAGGNGGDGGDGGQIRISYRLLSGYSPDRPIRQLIRLRSDGGPGGALGEGGEGGAGVEGQYVNMRTLTGNRKWIGGGDKGPIGAVGELGAKGSPGQALLQRVEPGSTASRLEALKPAESGGETGGSKLEQTVRALEARIKTLEEQVEALSRKIRP
ncbi:MAG: hypothetical protein SV765_12405 [Pseudomonadota bacterium]|nr:hypothetical protein [Pseudomonadota bacterium]